MNNELIKEIEQYLKALEEKGIDLLKNGIIKDVEHLLYEDGDKRNLSNLYKSCNVTKEILNELSILGGAKELLKRRISILKSREN